MENRVSRPRGILLDPVNIYRIPMHVRSSTVITIIERNHPPSSPPTSPPTFFPPVRYCVLISLLRSDRHPPRRRITLEQRTNERTIHPETNFSSSSSSFFFSLSLFLLENHTPVRFPYTNSPSIMHADSPFLPLSLSLSLSSFHPVD